MKETAKSIEQVVLELVRMIPKGRVTSYGAIAKAIGTPKSSRMVGWILGHSLEIGTYPAHRVVNRSGLLSGRHHFRPPERMEQLLTSEGVLVKDNKVVDFEALFWDPMQEV